MDFAASNAVWLNNRIYVMGGIDFRTFESNLGILVYEPVGNDLKLECNSTFTNLTYVPLNNSVFNFTRNNKTELYAHAGDFNNTDTHSIYKLSIKAPCE